MIDRRGVLRGTILLAAQPLMGCTVPSASERSPAGHRTTLTGSLEQGSLVIGRTDPKAQVLLGDTNLSISADGLFAFGIEYDRVNPIALAIRYGDGSSETRTVTPVVRQYEVQAITGLPEEYVSPPLDVAERIKGEHAAVAEARRKESDGTGFAQAFDWPVAGIISGVFGSRRVLNGEPKAPHFGVDIAAPAGSPIHAPADGIVSLSDDFYLEGGFTLLDHGHGVSTCYFHQSKRNVVAGAHVARGDPIGLVGMTGRATGPHLHWGMNWFQVRLDPSRSTATSAPPKL
jgi:murein DD-endopeptidase MepM/ murein hydrolase activator NlpD